MKRIFPVLFCVAALLCVPGCDLFDGKTTSPFTSKPATAEEIAAQANAEIATQTTKAKQDAEAEAVKSMRRKAEFDEAVSRLDADTRIALAKLQAEYDADARSAAGRILRIEADGQRAVQMVSDLAKAAVQKIENEKANLGALLDVAQGSAGLIPVAGVGTILGGLIGHMRGRYVGERRGWDEATEVAEKNTKTRDDHYDLGKNEMTLAAVLSALMGKGPPPASSSGA